MNWIIATRIPYPTARTAIPRHDVVFPFPSPVRTRTRPLRGFSGIRDSFFRGIRTSPGGFAGHALYWIISPKATSRQPEVRHGPGQETALHGLREGKGALRRHLRGVQGDDPGRSGGQAPPDQEGRRAGNEEG